MNDGKRNELFQKVQRYLKPSPLIIWGSGGTIPFGMPSMEYLKKELEIKKAGNLETILSEVTDKDSISNYKKKIYESINKKDAELRKNIANEVSIIKPLEKLISYFYETHPKIINITTTNYDCVLEYIFSYANFPFSDGFSGREFSQFDPSNFKERNHINLYKVHGSLRWFQERYSYTNTMMDGIFPMKDKYEKSHQEPYRTLIGKSDEAIVKAKCFLAVGFGFNDEHITPKIQTSINMDKKIVVIAKKATKSIKDKLDKANSIIIEEGDKKDTTQFSFKENGNPKTETLAGNYWKIEQFNQILMDE